MNNLLFKKIWQDDDMIEIKIEAESEYARARQTCYVQEYKLLEIADDIKKYIEDFTNSCYIQIGEKEGNSTPAFSMNILSADNFGHIKIEVDIEIEDCEERLHRNIFYIESELGLLESFGKKLKTFYNTEIGDMISMY